MNINIQQNAQSEELSLEVVGLEVVFPLYFFLPVLIDAPQLVQ